MKLALSLIAISALPAAAQMGSPRPARPAVAAKATPSAGGGEKAPGGLSALADLEKEMNSRLATTGGKDPSLLLGTTRALYISGFGAVFTAEVDLVNTPPAGGGLFPTAPLTAEQKAMYHKRKLAHVPLLQQTMRDTALSLAASPALKLTDSDQLVVSVRLVYRPWEDTSGLPGQIVVRMDRRGATPRVEVVQ